MVGSRGERGHAWIKMIGLAVALTSVMTVLLIARIETGYESGHQNADRIVRLVTDKIAQESVNFTALSPSPAAAAMVRDFPEVLAATRMTTYDGFWAPKVPVTIASEHYLEERLLFADPALLEVFTFDLVEGDRSALDGGDSLMISDTLARKYFGDERAVGRQIEIADLPPLRVSAVFRELPSNTMIRAPLFASFDVLERAFEETPLAGVFDQWPPLFYYTFALLDSHESFSALGLKLDDFALRYLGEDMAPRYRYLLERLTDIRFESDRAMDLTDGGDRQYLEIMLAVGLIILLVAAVNFVNLSTARAVYRARDIAVHKTLGATRGGLILRLLAEALAMSAVALTVAVALFLLLRQALEETFGIELPWLSIFELPFAAGMLGLTVMVGLAAGIYPAFKLASIDTAAGLNGLAHTSSGSLLIRRALVVLQLAGAIFLVVMTAVALGQIRFLTAEKLGLDDQDMIVVPIGSDPIAQQQISLKEMIGRTGSIVGSGRLSLAPGGIVPGRIYSPQGSVGSVDVNVGLATIDHDAADLLGLELLDGRMFDPARPTDSEDAFLANASAVNAFGWDEPVGMWVEKHPREGEADSTGAIVGVVADFQMEPLTEPANPMLISVSEEANQYLYVRTQPGQAGAALEEIERAWNDLAPELPMDYFLLRDAYADLYRNERQLTRILLSLSIVAVVLAVSGILSLVTFMVARRTREIGIRKVLGASAASIGGLFGREFAVLCAIGMFMAMPVTHALANRWLDSFAYRVDVAWWLLVLTGLGVSVLVVAPVLWHVRRAAGVRPAMALRTE